MKNIITTISVAVLILVIVTGCLQMQLPPDSWQSEQDVIRTFKNAFEKHDGTLLYPYEIPNNLPVKFKENPSFLDYSEIIFRFHPGSYKPRPASHETPSFRIIAQPGNLVWLEIDEVGTSAKTFVPIVKNKEGYFIYKPMYEKRTIEKEMKSDK
jgi:hypothetical protein